MKNIFGFKDFRPGQLEIVTAIEKGRDALVVMPTGSGKSICYQIPAILSEKRTIVISPLVALIDDQVLALQEKGLNISKIHSHQDYEKNADNWRNFARGHSKILYLSPERLMKPKMLDALKKLNIGMFVIDEAHCISKWGSGFRPDYEALSDLKNLFKEVQITAFTATADDATRKDIIDKLNLKNHPLFLKGFDRSNLSLAVRPKTQVKENILSFLSERKGQSGIVYCLSRKDTDEMADFLVANGFKSISYHAGKDASYRQDSQNRFMTESGLVMVATIAFGMGIDKSDIRFIVHASIPGSMEAFYQEIGRAGRDGEPADTVLFYSLQDFIRRQNMIFDGNESDEFKSLEYRRLQSLMGYCETIGCRKSALLNYFDETTEPCGNCDNCLQPPIVEDYSNEAKAVILAIKQTGQYFGQAHINTVVKGQQNAKIKERGHSQLSSYGMLSAQTKDEIQSLIRQLIASGALRVNLAKYGALEITRHGQKIHDGNQEFKAKKFSKTVSSPRAPKKQQATTSVLIDTIDKQLLEKLKFLRYEIAKEKKVPAYVVFHDSVLLELAVRKPTTREGFLSVNGIGPKKVDDLFEKFSSLISSFDVEGYD